MSGPASKGPRAERPDLPSGYLERKPLPWSWAVARLERARNYWIATVTPDGLPHSRPVWGVWLDDVFYFSTGGRIGTNLEHRSEVTLNLESGDECVILEGSAARDRDAATTARVVEHYNAKYAWDLRAEPGEFFAVRPRRAFGWLCDGSGEDGGVVFGQTATRWTFPRTD